MLCLVSVTSLGDAKFTCDIIFSYNGYISHLKLGVLIIEDVF